MGDVRKAFQQERQCPNKFHPKMDLVHNGSMFLGVSMGGTHCSHKQVASFPVGLTIEPPEEDWPAVIWPY